VVVFSGGGGGWGCAGKVAARLAHFRALNPGSGSAFYHHFFRFFSAFFPKKKSKTSQKFTELPSTV
jgi:hypothetical protein